MDANRATNSPATFAPPPAIQFYSIELAPGSDGRLYVRVAATICEQEGELENMDMGSSNVASLDEALTAIRQTILNCQ